MPRKIARYGWKRDLPSPFDTKLKVCHTKESLSAIPSEIDLRPLCPPVYDQGNLGRCTGACISGMVEFMQLKLKRAWDFTPSMNFIYYNERAIENTIDQDSGAQIRDGLSSLNTQGICTEKLCSDDVATFTNKPSAAAYTDALKHRATLYQSINQDIISMKTVLASGIPFVFGFTVYESFESDTVASTGVVNLPTTNEQVEGGHAVMCVGFDDSTQRFIVRNSWGSSWGQAGYFTIPYAYLTNNDLSSDFWCVSMLSN